MSSEILNSRVLIITNVIIPKNIIVFLEMNSPLYLSVSSLALLNPVCEIISLYSPQTKATVKKVLSINAYTFENAVGLIITNIANVIDE
jgi:hypothetical protein